MSKSNLPMIISQAAPSPKSGARRQDRLIKFLSQPLLLEESGPPRVLSQLLIVITVLVGGLIGFAGQSPWNAADRGVATVTQFDVPWTVAARGLP